jgi:hypothetical protein
MLSYLLGLAGASGYGSCKLMRDSKIAMQNDDRLVEDRLIDRF